MTGTEKWARPMALVEKWEPHMPWLMALLLGLFYICTMSPSIGHTDSGELAAVAYTFGVAHPTGYPLFTLLGWLFTRIPFASVAWQLNLMCLLFVAGSGFFWAKFLREFFIKMRTSVKKGDSSYALRIKVANLTGTISGTLMLGFGRTWWMQSTSLEVYSLQALLLMVMLWTLLKAWHAKENVFRAWTFFAIALALCFTNHLTAIVVLPGTLYLYFARFGFKWQSFRQGIGLAGIGLGVLVVFYGILVIVAQSEPAYNWGNPENWPRLWHHITGKQFNVMMFNGPKAFGVNLVAYLNRLPNELGWDLIWPKIPIWIGLGVMVFQGMTYAIQRRREWALFFGIGFFSNIFWAANYSIKDPEPYYLFSFITVAFLAAMVIRWSWIGMKKIAPYLTAAYLVVIGFQVVWNFGKVNQRGAWQYEDYARNCLASVGPNAIVISKSWDVFVGPSAYLQGCEGFRKDVTIIDYSLLHDRHWYPRQLAAQDPQLSQNLGPVLKAWELAVYDFDIRGKVLPNVLSPRFDAVYQGILAQIATRPIYITPEIFNAMLAGEIAKPPANVVPVPDRFLIRLQLAQNAQTYSPLLAANNQIRYGGDEDEYEKQLMKSFLSQNWNFRANYEAQFGHPMESEAFRVLAKALNAKPLGKFK